MKWKRQGAVIALSLVVLLLNACESDSGGGYGDPCGECRDGLQCAVGSTFPGGYCSRVCEDGMCGEGAICASELGPPLCLRACDDPSECRDGYQCWRGACRATCDVDPGVCGDGATCVAGRCQTACSSDPECPAGQRCVDGACTLADDAGGIAPNGTPCTSDHACASGLCLPAERGGICSAPCESTIDCISLVDLDAACAPVARPGGLVTACVPMMPDAAANGRQCATDAECTSRTCVDGQCTVSCATVGDCINGQRCGDVSWGGDSFQGCGYEPGTGVVAIDLGERDIAAGSLSREIVFATPPDSVSVTLVARTVSGDSLPLSFFEVHDPVETRIFSFEDIVELVDTPVRWLPADTEEAIAMLVPNATRDRLRYVPGAHRVQLAALPRTEDDTGRARVHLSALVKRTPNGMVSSGTIDLDVFLVGVGVSAAEAPAHTRVQNALGRFAQILSQASITVGDVAFHDVSEEDAAIFQVIDMDGPVNELPALFRLSASRTGRRVSMFFVRGFGGGGTLGVAGGIPGPPGVHGTGHSGVAIAFGRGSSGDDGSSVGHIMAHELGHFLGLFHTTEQLRPCSGTQLPPDCAPFGATDVIDDTDYDDRDNLMYWSVGGDGVLSRGQAFVLQRSALVR